MPKPLFLSRPAGLYVRFLVPFDLRPMVGSHFIIRRIPMPSGDHARLLASRMGVALSKAFEHLRHGDVVDIKNTLDLIIGQVRLPNGTLLTDVRVDTPDDERQLKNLMEMSGFKASPKPQAPKDLFSKQMAIHLADLERAGLDAKTIMESRHALALFLGIIGNKSVGNISGNDCRLFLDQVSYWPLHATKRPEYAGLSVAEILKKSKASNEPRPAQATLNKHRQRLSAFMTWLMDNKRIISNPLSGVKRPKKSDTEEDTGRPFSQAELDVIFEPFAFGEWSKDYPHRFWLPLLGLFSGARVNELSQLYVADIETIAGISGYHINKRFHGQKLKSAASRRFVPLAKPILDAGFLEYVTDVQKAGHERLFPHLPNNAGLGFGKQMTRQFCAYIQSRGVVEDGMGMHAFRHTLATRLDRAGVSVSTIAKITGHKAGGGVLPKYYIDPPTLSERVTAIEKFESGVTLPIYIKGKFNEALEEAHDLPEKWSAEKKKRLKSAKQWKGAKQSLRS